MVQLRMPSLDDEAGVRDAQRELAADGFMFALGLPIDPGRWRDAAYAAWVERVAAEARGDRLRPGWARSTFLLALVDGAPVGRVSIRHELTPALREDGGHIGYGVRPGARRRGHARTMLRHALDVLAAEGVEQALLTCAWDNHGSRATIEGAGGVLVGVRELDDSDEVQRRYLVPTSRDDHPSAPQPPA